MNNLVVFDLVSSPPQNVSIQRVTNTMARIQWTEPKSPNGRLQGYRIYILNVAANLTEVKKVINPHQYTMDFTINNLSKKTIHSSQYL
jgi:hypothetical protein